MIRLATYEDFPSYVQDESLLRILSLRDVYGVDVSFLRFYTDGVGSIMSIMDGVAVLYVNGILSEEWQHFALMNTDIRVLHTNRRVGDIICSNNCWAMETGAVLRYAGTDPVAEEEICQQPKLPLVYELLKDQFPKISPFDSWYVDISHRVRHGFCEIAAVIEGESVISVATTVAQIGEAAILGQVATHPNYRKQGLAGRCLRSLIHRLYSKELFILPISPIAQKLYENLGFVSVGEWAELTRNEG